MLSLPLAALLGQDPASGYDIQHDPAAIPVLALPARAAILGPLPPSAPLNLARWAVDVGSLPSFDGIAANPAHALVITGSRGDYHAALDEEDEPHLRNVAPEDGRIDLRYCPTVGHVRLLLSLLANGERSVYQLPELSLIVLYDILSLFDGNDENRAPGEGPFTTTPVSSYLNLISAACRAADHFHSPIVILEPNPPVSLPILPTTAVPESAKTRRVPLSSGLEWLVDCVAVVEAKEDGAYKLRVGDTAAYMARLPVPKAEFASAHGVEEEKGSAWVWSAPNAPSA